MSDALGHNRSLHPMQYAHVFVDLMSGLTESCDLSTYSIQGYFTGTGAVIKLQLFGVGLNSPEGYG